MGASNTGINEMALQFSPGPFEINYSVSGNFHWVEDAAGRTVCDFYVRNDECRPDPIFRFDHAAANARLFGHALEMHDFLTELAGLKSVHAGTAQWAQTRALILLAKIHRQDLRDEHPTVPPVHQVSHIS
jgi:hypothetical protein